MPTYHFVITLDRDPEPHIEALGDAGLLDALVSSDGTRGVAEFSRDADSLWNAVASAVASIHETEIRAVAVDLDGFDDVESAADLAPADVLAVAQLSALLTYRAGRAEISPERRAEIERLASPL